jgi:hypothetical protein
MKTMLSSVISNSSIAIVSSGLSIMATLTGWKVSVKPPVRLSQYLSKPWDKIPTVRAKDKGNTLPPELQDVWAKDRAKKAENKRLRAIARLAVAADPFVSHKGGKKGYKAMLGAAHVSDPTIAPLLPERITDMKDVVAQIRVFTANLWGSHTMVLPPMQPQDRKCVHELARAFGLSSKSKGKGDRRYTTLNKTTRTGFPTNEHAVARILQTAQAQSFGGARDSSFQQPTQRDKGKGKVTVPRHRDGDEVGKVRYQYSVPLLPSSSPCPHPGGAEDRRVQHRFPTAGLHGLARGRSHRAFGRFGRSPHCCNQELKAWSRRDPMTDTISSAQCFLSWRQSGLHMYTTPFQLHLLLGSAQAHCSSKRVNRDRILACTALSP